MLNFGYSNLRIADFVFSYKFFNIKSISYENAKVADIFKMSATFYICYFLYLNRLQY